MADALMVLRELSDEFEQISPHFRQLSADLAEALTTDPTKAPAMYCNVDWWGGSGSVADFVPVDVNTRRRIMRLLVDLVQAFDELGVTCPRASWWVDVFVEWLRHDTL
jgi:hypothetical protein